MADPFVAEIRIFPFNFAPKGWAWCDGQLLPLSQNTALFSLLQTTYGGDGKSTFALLVFNMSLQTCLLQNQHQARTHFIPEQMIAYQVQQLQQALAVIPHEGWDQVVMLDEQQRDDEIEVASV